MLYQRGTHRILGNPFLGTFTAFLTLLFLVRIAANLYLVIDLSKKGSTLDAVQIASVHFILLSAYIVWVGSLATLRISLSLPRLCFVNFSPRGRRFRSRFLRQISLLRPMNMASASIILLTAFILSMICANWRFVVVRALVVLCSTFTGFVIVIAVASWSLSRRSEIQIIEMLYLIFLVAVNPDIGFTDNRVSIFFGGRHYSFHGILDVAATIGLIVMLALLILLLVRVLSSMGNRLRRQLPLRPMERWYWRFLRIRSWVLLYMVVIPVFISSFTTVSTKRWAFVLSILFGVASYLYFIAQCETTLHEKRRCSLFDKGNLRLIARSVLIHIGLMTVPVIGYIIGK